MLSFEVLFAVVGLFVTIAIATPWILEWYLTYVICSLEVTDVQGGPVAKLALESKSVYRREIDWACLIVSRRDVDFVERINDQVAGILESTNDIINLKDVECHKFNSGDLRVIPLPFFNDEQIGIRDEKVTCAIPLDRDLTAGWYDVRFFVFPPANQARRFGIHRCVHTVCFLDRK